MSRIARTKYQVKQTKGELDKRLVGLAENVVNFLSSLSDKQTHRYDIQNRLAIISGARKVIGKQRMLDIVQAKIDIIDHKVKGVIELFKPLKIQGIPFFWEEKGPLLTQEEYIERWVLRRSEHKSFGDM